MGDERHEAGRAPKPRAPTRSKGEARAASPAPKQAKRQSPRTGAATAELGDRLAQMAGVLERVELALCPRQHASDVAAEEHALLNLLDSIVDRRTEALLLPVARLAAQLDRAGRTADSALRERLERDARVELEEVLGALGLERISAAQGDELQPLLHEEVGEAAVPGLEEGLVAELVRAGYRVRGGRVLLPALVLVAAAADP